MVFIAPSAPSQASAPAAPEEVMPLLATLKLSRLLVAMLMDAVPLGEDTRRRYVGWRAIADTIEVNGPTQAVITIANRIGWGIDNMIGWDGADELDDPSLEGALFATIHVIAPDACRAGWCVTTTNTFLLKGEPSTDALVGLLMFRWWHELLDWLRVGPDAVRYRDPHSADPAISGHPRALFGCHTDEELLAVLSTQPVAPQWGVGDAGGDLLAELAAHTSEVPGSAASRCATDATAV